MKDENVSWQNFPQRYRVKTREIKYLEEKKNTNHEFFFHPDTPQKISWQTLPVNKWNRRPSSHPIRTKFLRNPNPEARQYPFFWKNKKLPNMQKSRREKGKQTQPSNDQLLWFGIVTHLDLELQKATINLELASRRMVVPERYNAGAMTKKIAAPHPPNWFKEKDPAEKGKMFLRWVVMWRGHRKS